MMRQEIVSTVCRAIASRKGMPIEDVSEDQWTLHPPLDLEFLEMREIWRELGCSFHIAVPLNEPFTGMRRVSDIADYIAQALSSHRKD